MNDLIFGIARRSSTHVQNVGIAKIHIRCGSRVTIKTNVNLTYRNRGSLNFTLAVSLYISWARPWGLTLVFHHSYSSTTRDTLCIPFIFSSLQQKRGHWLEIKSMRKAFDDDGDINWWNGNRMPAITRSLMRKSISNGDKGYCDWLPLRVGIFLAAFLRLNPDVRRWFIPGNFVHRPRYYYRNLSYDLSQSNLFTGQDITQWTYHMIYPRQFCSQAEILLQEHNYYI